MMPGMATLQNPISFPVFSSFYGAVTNKSCCLGLKILLPTTSCCSPKKRKIGFLLKNGFKMKCCEERWMFVRKGVNTDGILMRNGRRVMVRTSGFSGGGGGSDNNSNSRALVNLGLAIGLAYLTLTGQLGWILDTIVSISLLAVLLPIAGLVAFFWFAGRDIVQSSCPNCGNNFQILKSSSKDGLHICPYCSRPFSVQGDQFVRESDGFPSNSSQAYGQVFNNNSRQSQKGKGSSATTVDIEAEVKDIE